MAAAEHANRASPDCRYYSAAVRAGTCWARGLAGVRRKAGRGKRRMAFRPGALSSSSNCALWKCATAATNERPRPGARRIAAGFQAHKTLHHAAALMGGNAGTGIGNREIDAGERLADGNRHLAAGRRVFDGIVHQIGQRLRHQAAHAFDHRHAGGGKRELTHSVLPPAVRTIRSHRAPPRPDPAATWRPAPCRHRSRRSEASALKVPIS